MQSVQELEAKIKEIIKYKEQTRNYNIVLYIDKNIFK